MRKTKFGAMQRLHLGGFLQGQCEVMRFDSVGTYHSHPSTEVAICVAGEGVVEFDVGGDLGRSDHALKPGSVVEIPSRVRHRMRPGRANGPGDDGPLHMLIAYKVEAKTP